MTLPETVFVGPRVYTKETTTCPLETVTNVKKEASVRSGRLQFTIKTRTVSLSRRTFTLVKS